MQPFCFTSITTIQLYAAKQKSIMHNNLFYFIACVVLKLIHWSLIAQMIMLFRVKPICPTKLLLIIKCLESRKILKNKFDGAICLADFPSWSHLAIMSHFMLSVFQLLQPSIYFLCLFSKSPFISCGSENAE